MAAASTLDPELNSALSFCVSTLRRMAEYELDETLNRRMSDMQQNKEFLNADEHEELMALVRFSQARTLEKLEALAALKRLQTVAPSLFANS